MLAAVIKEFGGPEVLVRVGASGVNPVDTYIRNGQYAVLPTLPYTPGRDGAGIVEKVGADVRDVNIGDRVFFASPVTGSAAEYCLADRVFPLPPGLTLQEGACVGVPYMTAYRALFLLGKAQKGQRILVHGASGGVGVAAVQMAAERGCTVVGTAGTDDGAKLVLTNGATDVFNHRTAGYLEEMKKKYPEGFDLIVEMAAHQNLASDLDLLAKNGRVAIVESRGEVKVNPRALMSKESSVFGVQLGLSTPEDWAESSSYVYKFLNSSRFRPAIGRVYPLESIAAAHRDIMAGGGAHGKLIVSINDQL
ncbi:unnamed protein product [Heligmosomoides polygyrus]|uniref:PKS_ER domain-containing protein n=1 Tax=Heligmosomoides polygyrus TaxID=6339 RepID=A0A183FJY9_HELPZ|nr:unnamed protein product [Heligmosomoides polygyrus]